MQERDLSGEDVVALFLDGKTFADATMVVALGITLSGDGDGHGECGGVDAVPAFTARGGTRYLQGLLVIIDGGKGLQAGVKKVFRKRALVQRCPWHKRENVVSYLSKASRRRGASGFSGPTTGRSTKTRTLGEGRPLEELEPTQRWLATALVDIEPRSRKVMGYRHHSQASRSSQAGTEDRGEDINGIEEQGRVIVSRGEFQLRVTRLTSLVKSRRFPTTRVRRSPAVLIL